MGSLKNVPETPDSIDAAIRKLAERIMHSRACTTLDSILTDCVVVTSASLDIAMREFDDSSRMSLARLHLCASARLVSTMLNQASNYLTNNQLAKATVVLIRAEKLFDTAVANVDES